MGLYPIKCPSCNDDILWFSGNSNQLCKNCTENYSVETFVSGEASTTIIATNSTAPELPHYDESGSAEEFEKFYKENPFIHGMNKSILYYVWKNALQMRGYEA